MPEHCIIDIIKGLFCFPIDQRTVMDGGTSVWPELCGGSRVEGQGGFLLNTKYTRSLAQPSHPLGNIWQERKGSESERR